MQWAAPLLERRSAAVRSQVDLSRRLDLSQIADQTELGARLTAQDALEELECGHNDVGDAGVVSLLALMRQPSVCAQLRYIGLARNAIGDRGATAIAKHLESAATPRLERLDLRDNAIGDEGAAALGRALQHTRNLREIVLFHNAISRFDT